MNRTFKIILQSIFILTIAFSVLTILFVLLMALFSLEFKDSDLKFRVYYTMFLLVPVAIILTLSKTLKAANNWRKNLKTSIYTFILAGLFFYGIGPGIMFSSFGAWTNEWILYENKSDSNITINQQIYDVGALGYGSRRIVKIRPVLKYFKQEVLIDTAELDKNDWVLVNSEGDIRFP